MKSWIRGICLVCAVWLCLTFVCVPSAQAAEVCEHAWVDGHVDVASGNIVYWCLHCGAEKGVALGAPGMTDFDTSGNLDMDFSTRESIAQIRSAIATSSQIFAVEPSVKAPYTAGKITDAQLKGGLAYLNYIRTIARLPQVTMSDSLNDYAQHGAVLLAASGTLSHRPGKPSGMTDDFYYKGYKGTSSSNIAWTSGYSGQSYLQTSLLGYMQDSSSATNRGAVGHRRQLLHTKLDSVGFGYAKSASGGHYSATWVQDCDAPGVDYEFVAWPSSGYVPTELFDLGTPWSVSLNPNLYKTPSLDKVKVKITRVSDGKTWNLDKSTGSYNTPYNPYLTVNTESYGGISNAIIFLPYVTAKGVFTVEISGIYTKAGKETTLRYWVDFFGVQDCARDEHNLTVNSYTANCYFAGYNWYLCSNPNCGFSEETNYVPAGHKYSFWTIDSEPAGGFGKGNMHRSCSACGQVNPEVYDFTLTDVPAGKYFSKPVYWAYVNGITKGKTTTEFQRDAECTRKQIVMFLWRAAGEPEPKEMKHSFVDVKHDQFEKAIVWAVEMGITNGTGDGTTFSPEAPCTRDQIVMFLWRYFGKPEPKGDESPFTDVVMGTTFAKPILWAVEQGITTGKTETTFEPKSPCTRGQIVTFLYRAMVA